MAAVAVDILSGFLGSGKTTLLRHVLTQDLGNKRLAVVMNEIGDVGLDGKVITGLGAIEKMVELSSGCICCSIDEYRFDLAIQEILDTAKPDLVVIESTGLADPEALAERARGAGLAVDAVITVVDVRNIARCLRETVVAKRQIASADFLVLNKIDLVDESTLRKVERRLRRLNRRAAWFRSVRGVVEAPLLFAPGVARYRRAAQGARGASASGHLQEDGIEAFLFRSSRRLRREGFEREVARLPPEVYRAKGIVRFAGSEFQVLFNYTCGRSESSWVSLPEMGDESQLVIIGRDAAAYREQVLSGLASCEEERG